MSHIISKSQRSLATPIGSLLVTATAGQICSLRFVDNDEEESVQALTKRNDEVLELAVTQLREYFAGHRMIFDVPVRPVGTTFQQHVWGALTQIPYGATVSYGALAERLGKPSAARAVGQANNKNPLPILIPCHRVIGTSGKIVGFACGVERQRWLLQHERVMFLEKQNDAFDAVKHGCGVKTLIYENAEIKIDGKGRAQEDFEALVRQP